MLRVQCQHCQSWFSRKDVLLRHQRNMHEATPPPPPPPPPPPSPPPPPPPPPLQDFVFRHPFTAIVTGPTSCGKTYFVKTLLQNCMTKISPPPERIIWLYKRWQPLYDVIKKTVYPKVDFIQGTCIPLDLDQDSFINPSARNLVILDDPMSTATKDSRINELFTEGSHHRNLSVIAINQNLYFNKDPTQIRNCHYLVMFNNPVDVSGKSAELAQTFSGSHLQTIRLFSHRHETFYTRTFAQEDHKRESIRYREKITGINLENLSNQRRGNAIL